MMKRFICALLLTCLLAMSAAALADGSHMVEAIMIYEDYDGNHAEQTIDDADLLLELEAMLLRTSQNPDVLDGNTMNSTLFCMLEDGVIYDFAIATDGSPYITDMNTDETYTFGDDDLVRFWEIFYEINQAMGFNASDVWNW